MANSEEYDTIIIGASKAALFLAPALVQPLDPVFDLQFAVAPFQALEIQEAGEAQGDGIGKGGDEVQIALGELPRFRIDDGNAAAFEGYANDRTGDRIGLKGLIPAPPVLWERLFDIFVGSLDNSGGHLALFKHR